MKKMMVVAMLGVGLFAVNSTAVAAGAESNKAIIVNRLDRDIIYFYEQSMRHPDDRTLDDIFNTLRMLDPKIGEQIIVELQQGKYKIAGGKEKLRKNLELLLRHIDEAKLKKPVKAENIQKMLKALRSAARG